MKMKKAILFILCIGIIISLFSLPALADPSMAEFTELENGFELTIAEPVSGDSYQLWVGKVGVTEDELADISDEDDFMEKVGYVDFAFVKINSPITFTFTMSDPTAYGTYIARLIRTGAGDDIEDAYYKYKAADPTLASRAMEAFMNVNSDEEFAEVVTKFSNEPDEFFKKDELGIFQDEAIAKSVGANFALIRDYKYADGGSFGFASEIISCAESAYALSAFLGDDVKEAEDRISKYGSFVSELLPAKADTSVTMKLVSAGKEYIEDGESLGIILGAAKTYGKSANNNTLEILSGIKSDIKSAEQFEDVIRWATMLGNLVDASRSEIEKIISDNDDFFGVDTSADAHYGISLARVAQRFDVNEADSLYGKDAFSAYYDSVAKKIADEEEEKKEAAEDKKEDNRKGSGGGGLGGLTVYTKPVEVPPASNEQTVNTQTAVAGLPFTDIADCAWAHEYIKALYDKGIVTGVSADSFEPNRAVTRAEFVKMLVNGFGISANNDVAFDFDDVTKDMWSYPYIETAYKGGIVSGMSKKYFGAQETITRQDAAVMISRILGASSASQKDVFADSQNISDYAKDAVAFVSNRGIMNGMSDGNFEPMSITTRAQAAAIISRALQGGAAE